MADPTQAGLYDQLLQFCTCVEEVTDRDVADMIGVVSLATGWTINPCESFELGERREVIDLPSCMDCPYEFSPYYTPFDADSFTFTLIKRKGLEEERISLTNFRYTGFDERDMKYEGGFLVDTELPKCECTCGDECGCPTEYKLLVTYDAGYDILPECLLPVLCNLLEVIHAKNSCDCGGCGCNSGDTVTYDADGNVTTQEIKYKSGDVVSVFLETDLAKMLVEQYKNQLGMISLLKYNHDVWGFVV